MSMIDSFIFEVTKSNVYWKSAIKDGKLNVMLQQYQAMLILNYCKLKSDLKRISYRKTISKVSTQE